FDTWLDDLQLYLLSDSKDSVSLFDLVSGAATAPPATTDSATCSQWLTRDAPARLAICNHLLLAECAHFGQHRTAQALYDAVVTPYSSHATAALGRLLLPYLFPELSAFATIEDLVSHLRTSDARYRATVPAEDHFLSLDPTSLTVDLLEQHLLVAETSAVAVGAARGTPHPPFFEGCSPSPLAPFYASAAAADVYVPEDVGTAFASAKRRSSKGKGGRGGGGGSGGGGGGGGSGGGGSNGGGGSGGTGGGSGGSGGGGEGSGGSGGSGGGGIGGGGIGARRVGSGDGQRQQQQRRSETPSPQQLLLRVTVPPDPGIAAAALGASEFGTLPSSALAEALHTWTPAPRASSFVTAPPSLLFLHLSRSVWLTPLGDRSWPVPPLSSRVRQFRPAHWSACVDLHMHTDGRHLATFTRQVAASCSCRLLSHQTLLWHHRLGHPSPPRLRGMHSCLLVSGLPRSLPPLPPSPAPPGLPCVEGRQRAARHSSSFPLTTAPLQTLQLDVWGPARVSGQSRERYFLLVVDDYTRYTTVFPLRRKGQVVDVLIPWIRTVRLQICERFGQDLPVLRLHSDRGGEFSSSVLRDFCRGEGILQSFTLPDSPQQNGIAERRICLVMEVARTSMIHAAAPHFLWPFAVRYAAHQLNLWPRVSLPETSPALHWTREVGDASVFWVWESRAFVRDMSADKLSPRAIPCDLTFNESVPTYRLFPYSSAPPLPPPLFLAPGPPPVDPLPPQGPAPSGVSQVDPLPGTAPVQVAVGSGAAPGAASGGAASEGFEPGGAETEGAETRGAKPGGVGIGGAEPEGAAARAGVTGGTAATGPGGARTWETGAAGTGGVEGVGAGDPTEPGATGTGGAGAGGAGVGGPGAGGAGAAGAGVGGTRAGGAGAAGAGAVDPGAGGAGGTVRPRPYFSQLLLQPASPLPAPCPYTEQSGGLTEHREPASRPVLPVCSARRDPHSPPPPVPGMHVMALRPSSVPLRVPLPAPPESSPLEVPNPASDRAGAVSPTVARLLATGVTEPSFESAATSAVVAELLDFAAACGLDYASALVAESASACPPSVGGECALGTYVLEDRQEDFECLAAAVPRFASMLLAPEGDPDAPDILTLRSYAEAITGPYSTQWQAAMDAEMASWKSTGTYVDEVPPPGVNIVDGMWIFRGVDYFQTFSPTPKMTTLRVLLHVSAQSDYELRSLDFSTTFMQGSLHEEIWLRRPPCFAWTTLAALWFAPATANLSLFLRTDTSLPPFYILLWVNDLVFATADTKALTLVKSELQKRHTCTDLGELHSYLGLQITRDRARRTITLTQSHMVHQVLQRFGFQFSLPQSTPLSTSHSFSAPPSDESVEPSGPYPELVGCLMYLMTCTQPDLAYPLSLLSHCVAPVRQAWGSCLEDGVQLSSSDMQTPPSSSCEAEIYAGAMAAQELRWLTYLLFDLGEQPRSPPVLYVDNKA
ncbi:unnamed protein product, partial [Closterium sp. NIES-53]